MTKLQPWQKLALKKLPIKCPHCKKSLKANKTDLFCDNPNCHGAQFERIAHFFEVIKVDDLAAGVLEQLINAGYDNIPKLLAVTPSQLAKIEGFQERKANKIAKGLNNALKDVPLAKLMHASSCFSTETSGLGSTKLQWVIDEFKATKLLASTFKMDAAFEAKLAAIKGFGEVGAKLFIEGLPEFLKLYRKIQNGVQLSDGQMDSTALAGEGFAFTGFRNEELEKLITKNGGKVTSGVTNSTTVLFCADSSTSKAQKAQEKGVKIVASNEAEAYLKKEIS